jgi:hypothetical protein
MGGVMVNMVAQWCEVSECCLTPIQQFFSHVIGNFQWDDDEVRFVLDQYAELDLYSASFVQNQPA